MNGILAIGLIVCATVDKTSEYVERGMNAFRGGQVQESLIQFDRAIEIDPRIEPYLWQRGISQYCLGEYESGKQQFEIHKTVNPNDVENAAWHYLCVGKLKGKAAAKKSLIAINTDHDRRVPMKEIYQYLAGNADESDILRAADKADTPQARMYAHLYLGLCSEINGEKPKMIRHLKAASAQMLTHSYMRDAARVYLQQTQKRENQISDKTNRIKNGTQDEK